MSTQPPNQHAFLTTRWSMVLAAGDSDDSPAMEELLRAYWFPLYAFVRRSGKDVHDAQDLTQGFLLYALEREVIARADRDRGRFRSYLLGSLKNYMANAHRLANAQKRGGGNSIVSINDEHGEERYQLEATSEISPSEHFERSWAIALLDRVLVRLRTEFEKAGRLALFEAIEPRLTGAGDGKSYAAIAEELDISEGTIGVTVHRLRHRYGELLRQEVADTVENPEDVEAELLHLMAAVSGP